LHTTRGGEPAAPAQPNERGPAMRWVYVIVVVVFVLALILFAIQNREVVTMAFLGFSLRAPLAILAAIAYVLGGITGGSLYALLRKSVRESRLRTVR
jgi:putative membrane protein